MPVNESEFDQDIEFIVTELVGTLDGMPSIGPPFGSVKLSTEEQGQRYREMRDKPEEWQALLKEKPWPDVIEYALLQERRLKESEDVIQ